MQLGQQRHTERLDNKNARVPNPAVDLEGQSAKY